ncbi:hypothetical protein JCM11491_002433 [Sporobolomyces phaffii]
MAPRKAPTSRGSADAGDSAIASTSAPTATVSNEVGAASNAIEGERTGDDQQISQILAESLPSLPNVSTVESGVLPLPLGQSGGPTANPLVNGEGSAQASDAAVSHPEAEMDELANSGEGDDTGTAGSTRASGGRGKGKKTEKRARGNGDEHKQMTEEEWEQSRKANHKEVERRRRETINAGLDSLAALLPPPPPPPPGVPSFARNAKPNKSEILGQGINYIKTLKKAQLADANKWALEKLLKDQEIKKGQQEIDALKEENEALKKLISQFEGGGAAGAGMRQDGGETDSGERDNKRRRVEDDAL